MAQHVLVTWTLLAFLYSQGASVAEGVTSWRVLGTCGEGWVADATSRHCRAIFTWPSHADNFDDSRSYCQSWGGDLISRVVWDKEWLRVVVGGQGLEGEDALTWVGARLVQDQWVWLETGQPLDDDLLVWEEEGSGECAAFTASATLARRPCSQRLNYVCHRAFGVPKRCDVSAGWRLIGSTCYLTSRVQRSWEEARSRCGMESGQLLTVTLPQQQQYAHDAALTRQDKVWIGFSDKGHPGQWEWADGTQSNLTYWAESQPAFVEGGGAAAVSDTDPWGRWVAERNTDPHHYVCTKPAGGCVDGWREWEGRCYYVSVGAEDLVVWQTARATCQAAGAALVVLRSPDQDRWLRAHVPERSGLWIGLYSDPSSDSFYWTDGANLTTYNFTFITEADVQTALDAEEPKCVFLQVIEQVSGGTASSWVPTECHLPQYYACEMAVGDALLTPPDSEVFNYCSENWLVLDNYCYLFAAHVVTWTSARSTCQSLGAEMASIHSWPEQDFVHNHQASSGWVGLRREGSEWLWADGSVLDLTNWAQEEAWSEGCVEVAAEDGRWWAASCALTKTFTCRRPAEQYPVELPSIPSALPTQTWCGADWVLDATTDLCYLLVPNELPFQEARLHCHSLGGADLASVTSPHQHEFLIALVSEEGLGEAGVWLGLRNDPLEGAGWVDGSPLTYHSWAPAQPNAPHSDHCVEMSLVDGGWDDAACDLPKPFVCQLRGSDSQAHTSSSAQVKCSEGWQVFNDHCYYFSTALASWKVAEGWCKDHLGHLASITSREENTFILGEVHTGGEDLWLGLVGDTELGSWRWVDGTNFLYSNWWAGHPTDDGLCVQYKADGTWKESTWVTAPCDLHRAFICKTTLGSCPQGWKHYNGQCYHASDVGEVWRLAQEKCRDFSRFANLASIHSVQEDAFLTEVFGTRLGSNYWIGLSYDLVTGSWVWSDGHSLDYTRWTPGEPKDRLDWDLCGQLLHAPGIPLHGDWATLLCDTNRPYVCQMPASHSVGCRAGWAALGQHCYWYSGHNITALAASYLDASAACRSMDAQLASIHSTRENQLVLSLISLRAEAGVYVGLTDDGHPGTAAWLDGTDLDYTAWGQFLANPFTSQPVCGVVRDDGWWVLAPCTSPRPFLCRQPRHAVPLTPTPSGCDQGDTAHLGSCYHRPDLQYTWDEANTFCHSNNGYLAVVNDRYENGFLSSLLLGRDTWLGLSVVPEADGSLTFTWVNNDLVLFTSWGAGQPATQYGRCVAAAGGVDPGSWLVEDCHTPLHFICEYERQMSTAAAPITLPPSPATQLCPSSWVFLGHWCYKTFPEPRSWTLGEALCIQLGGHLASVVSHQEQQFLMDLLATDLVDEASYVWLGLRHGDRSGYGWSDGRGLGFVNWAVGQPEDALDIHRCGAVLRTSMQVSNAPCTTTLPFVCQISKGAEVQTSTAPLPSPPTTLCNGNSSWMLFGDHCYLLFSAARVPPASWRASRLRCQQEGGDLASIHTQEENTWLAALVSWLSDRLVWVGGRAVLGSGFTWADLTPFDFDYWAEGEPDNFQGQEDCVGLYGHLGSRWGDHDCSSLAGSVCKKPLASPTTSPAPAPSVPQGNCPPGWLHLATSCVLVSDEAVSFQQAEEQCSELAALLGIHSAFQQAFLTAELQVLGRDVWLGLHQIDGSYRWLDGSSITFTNWASGEPNGASTGESCVQADHVTGQWRDGSCESSLSFICLADQDPFMPSDPPHATCPPPHHNYLQYSNACYRLSTAVLTWKDAEAACAAEDAHLVSAGTPGEAAMLWTLAATQNVSLAWIGLNDRQVGVQYVWTDETATRYTAWGRGQPDGRAFNHQCVLLNATDGLWYVQDCDDLRPYVCKHSNRSVVGQEPPVTGYCPDTRWTDLGTQHCYLLSTSAHTWTHARTTCVAEGGQLASVHTQQDVYLLMAVVEDVPEPVWLGLALTQHGYRWSDGSGVNYLNWMTSDGAAAGEDGCVEMAPSTGLWNPTSCSDRRRYICKTFKIQLEQVTNPQRAAPYTPIPPTTSSPPTGPELRPGGIVGICVATVFLVACVGVVVLRYLRTRPLPPGTETASYDFENLDGLAVDEDEDAASSR